MEANAVHRSAPPEQLEAWRYILTPGLGVVSLLGQVLGQVTLIAQGSLLARHLFRTRKDTATPLTPATDS